MPHFSGCQFVFVRFNLHRTPAEPNCVATSEYHGAGWRAGPSGFTHVPGLRESQILAAKMNLEQMPPARKRQQLAASLF
jgi:hypothetical protein